MKILIVGSGGREHAITWRLAQDAAKHSLYCAPGNAGTGALAENLPLGAEDVGGIVAWARENRPDLVVVGPEAPLCAGLVDALEAVGVKAFGPVKAGARMEGSKRFAKEVMSAAGVPTGRAETFADPAAAKAALAAYGLPVVIKADGLAAGKGVVVAETREQAEAAIDDMLVGNRFGAAGAEVLVEEFLDGEECSILALVDGERVALLPTSQDHKRVFDGDRGPNTGGMGAYSPAPVVTEAMLPEIRDRIILPVVRELGKRGIVYRGVLYAGLMITPDGGRLAKSGSRINVVEFNARFGDPETEAVLPRIRGDFAELLLSVAEGRLDPAAVRVDARAAATVIVASGGYPGAYSKGKAIYGLPEAAATGALVFHCGTAAKDGNVVTAGGRVLSVTGLGADLRAAVDGAYAGVGQIAFEGAFHRKDIAHRAFERGVKRTRPVFLVLSAPSGCGKSTLIDMLLQEYPDMVYSISCTTRAPRGEEEDGLDYHFLSVERFRELIAEQAFIEHAEVHGNYYGTLRRPIEEVLREGNSMILDIDVAGAAKVRAYVASLAPDDPLRAGYADIFIMPPSLEVLRARLEGRGTDAPETIERRLANAEGEIDRADEYMFKVTNDDLGMCYRKLCDLIDVRTGRM